MTIKGILMDKKVSLTKNGKEYLVFTVRNTENTYNCKVWDNSSAFDTLRNVDCDGQVVELVGDENEYQGVVSIIVSHALCLPNEDATPYIPTKYNIDAYWTSLISLLGNWMTNEGLAITTSVLTPIKDRFCVEFAAKSHHDNCKGGLLAHTYKVVSLMTYTLTTYMGIHGKTKLADLYLMSAVFHDIGKVKEMRLGTYQPVSIAKHLYLSVEMLPADKIKEVYGEDYWYTLVSAILQHHGEYGEPCKSVVSYVLHKIDMFDSRLTDLVQEMDRGLGDVRVDSSHLMRGYEEDELDKRS